MSYGELDTSGSLLELKLERLRRLKELQDRAAQMNTGVAKYYDDPVGFAQDCINWGSYSLASYQADVLTDLQKHHRVAIRAPHGTGKSATSALTILWFATTREAMKIDWKVVTTAGAWRQLILHTPVGNYWGM